MNLRKDHSHENPTSPRVSLRGARDVFPVPGSITRSVAGVVSGRACRDRGPVSGFLGMGRPSAGVFHANGYSPMFAAIHHKLSATDASARVPMKDAAKCDTHCELQNSVNQQISERILRSRVSPVSISASVFASSHASPRARARVETDAARARPGVCVC